MTPTEIRRRTRSLVADGAAKHGEIARQAGIDPAQLTRFLVGKGDKGLSAPKLGALASIIVQMTSGGDPLPEEHAQRLAGKLQENQLTLFVGAGLSHVAPRRDGGNARLPLWDELSRQVATRCNLADPAAFRDPLDVFDAIAYGQDRNTLEEALRATLDDREYAPAAAHDALKALPWRAVVTTNYDSLLSRAFALTPAAKEADYAALPADDIPRLMQIHGTLAEPHTLTRKDYRSWPEKNPEAWNRLKRLLTETTFLFVGYGLGDPHIEQLLETMRDQSASLKKQLFAWLWRCPPDYAQLLRARDSIDVVAIRQADDFARAFMQLDAAMTVPALDGAPPVAAPARAPAPARPSYAYDRLQYFKAVEKRYGSPDLRALAPPRDAYRDDSVPLARIFVEPDLSLTDARPDGVWRRHSLGLAAAPQDGENADSDSQRELQDARDRRDEYQKFAETMQLRRADTVLRDHSRLVVLGDPGAGKSSLLRVWLLAATKRWSDPPAGATGGATAEPFPILIRLRDWTAIGGPAEGKLLRYLESQVPRLGEISRRAVAQWRNGPVLWLLDGIDEIRDDEVRREFADETRALASLRPRDRFVVASRPAGYRTAPFDAAWTVSEIAPLAEPQAEKLLANWALFLEERDREEIKPQAIAAEMKRDAGLRPLGGNPLLLTMVVLFFRAHRRLPRDRWEFYEHATNALRDRWARDRLPRAGDHLPREAYMDALLCNLALAGMRRGRIVFSRAEIVAEAERLMRDAHGLSADAIAEEMPRLLRAAEDLIGVLVAQGPGLFGFLHLTFQEFYAAKALSKRAAAPIIAEHWDDPSWPETWLLYALSIEDDERKRNELIDTIWAARDGDDEPLLERPALACLRLAGFGKMKAETIHGWQEIEYWALQALDRPSVVRDRIFGTLQIWEKPFASALRRSLLAAMADKDGEVRGAAIEALAAQAGEPEIRKALLAATADEDSRLRGGAVAALAAQAGVPEIRKTLFAATADEAGSVRGAAVRALAAQAGEPEIRKALLAALTDNYREVRRAAVNALAAHASEPEIREALLAAIADKDRSERIFTIEALEPQAGEPDIRKALLAALTDNNGEVRGAAVYALADQAGEPDIREALLAATADKDGSVRGAAIFVLAEQAGEPESRKALLAALADKDGAVRRSAIYGLADQAGETDIREALLAATADKDGSVRVAAVDVLADQVGEPEIRNVLLAAAADEEERVRRAAVQALAALAGDPEIRKTLLAAMADEEKEVRYFAVDALDGQAGEPQIRKALLAATADEHLVVRYAAVRALYARIGDDDVVAAMRELMSEYFPLASNAAYNVLARAAYHRKRARLAQEAF